MIPSHASMWGVFAQAHRLMLNPPPSRARWSRTELAVALCCRELHAAAALSQEHGGCAGSTASRVTALASAVVRANICPCDEYTLRCCSGHAFARQGNHGAGRPQDVRADGRGSAGGGRAHQEADHRHDRYDCGTRPCAAAARALERAGPDRCPAWEHDKQQLVSRLSP
ncbi:hypothetical protein T492DRAFT_1065260 [Pavlovales sp. CCMP2436]|nr:hypothetical protein T492DRAFT_1065260 [Pavlovales sp. CCMP2436]